MPMPSEKKLNIVSLVKGVREVFDMETVSVRIESERSKIFIVADKDQFVRVFNNLIKNAIQAIPSDKTGIVAIAIKVIDNKVHVSVSDNGIGISKSQEGKIFVPYFTTKSTGTGLGLAMVKQIIENHRGTIDFESTLGEGTTFEIILPLADEQA